MKYSRHWPCNGPQTNDDAASWESHKCSNLKSVAGACRLRYQFSEDNDQNGGNDDGQDFAGKQWVEYFRKRLQERESVSMVITEQHSIKTHLVGDHVGYEQCRE